MKNSLQRVLSSVVIPPCVTLALKRSLPSAIEILERSPSASFSFWLCLGVCDIFHQHRTGQRKSRGCSWHQHKEVITSLDGLFSVVLHLLPLFCTRYSSVCISSLKFQLPRLNTLSPLLKSSHPFPFLLIFCVAFKICVSNSLSRS
jgi:hypothetical protein